MQPCVPWGWCANTNDWCGDGLGIGTNAARMGSDGVKYCVDGAGVGTSFWMQGGG